ncbi:MAG: response regulator [Magnetococcales bacterium]|nr:response regulator [Magnetococcales bacterium]
MNDGSPRTNPPAAASPEADDPLWHPDAEPPPGEMDDDPENQTILATIHHMIGVVMLLLVAFAGYRIWEEWEGSQTASWELKRNLAAAAVESAQRMSGAMSMLNVASIDGRLEESRQMFERQGVRFKLWMEKPAGYERHADAPSMMMLERLMENVRAKNTQDIPPRLLPGLQTEIAFLAALERLGRHAGDQPGGFKDWLDAASYQKRLKELQSWQSGWLAPREKERMALALAGLEGFWWREADQQFEAVAALKRDGSCLICHREGAGETVYFSVSKNLATEMAALQRRIFFQIGESALFLLGLGSVILVWRRRAARIVHRLEERRREADRINRELTVQMAERAKAEEALARQASLLRVLLDTIPQPIYYKDHQGRYLGCNLACEQLLGVTREKMLGRTAQDLFPPAMAEVITRSDRTLLEQGGSQSFETEMSTPAGGKLPVHFLKAAFRLPPSPEEPPGSTSPVAGVVGAILDLSQSKQTESLLRQATRAAEEASRAKSEFLAMMSHEIRTPMNAILGMSELLSETELTQEQLNRVAVLRKAGESLLALIDDILDLSRVESGRIQVERAAFDLEELLTLLSGMLEPQARRKGLHFEVRSDSRIPRQLMGDAARLRQILLNLLGNAIKFTDHGGVRLEVDLGPQAEKGLYLAFKVWDSGVGIAPDKLESIFDAFTQADSSVTRRYGGTGLGLAISRRLAERMGGDLWAESRQGEGSQFILVTPFGQPETEPAPTAAPVLAPAAPHRPLALLLAEDAPDNILLIQAFLRDSGHRLTVVENGLEALEQFKEGRFDAVLMDIQMPVMDGESAVREIRAWEKLMGRPRTPIAALTAHALREHEQRSLQAGCDLHLSKPVKRRDLLQAIARLGALRQENG